jgi:hypothetical protein
MAEISIEVSGVELALERLNKVNNVLWARAPMQQSLRLLQEKLADYPAERPRQTYVRTGRLGKAWTVETLEQTPQRVHMRAGNNVRYAPWVQSKNFQARIHRGRWLTEADAVEQNRQQIAAIFEAAIRRVAG